MRRFELFVLIVLTLNEFNLSESRDYYNIALGKRYHFNESHFNYTQQIDYCKNMGGSVIKLESQSESDWIRDNIRLTSTIMLGAQPFKDPTDTETTWLDGSPMVWTNWAWGQPRRGPEFCTYIDFFRDSMKWFTHKVSETTNDCNYYGPVLCQIPFKMDLEQLEPKLDIIEKKLSDLERESQLQSHLIKQIHLKEKILTKYETEISDLLIKNERLDKYNKQLEKEISEFNQS